MTANRILLHRFIHSVPRAPAILMANSMGGTVSLIEAAAAAEAVAGMILLGPGLPFLPARPGRLIAMSAAYATAGLRWLMAASKRALSPEALTAATLSVFCADASRVPKDAVAQLVAMARCRARLPRSTRDFLAAALSVSTTVSYFRGSAYWRAIRSITAPVLLLHGDRDWLLQVAVARAAVADNPSWSLTVLHDIGHLPHLEAPHDTAQAAFDWLDAGGRQAVQAATSRLPGQI